MSMKKHESKALRLSRVILLTALMLLLYSAACTISSSKTLRVRGSAIPPQVSLSEPRNVEIEVSVENIGNETQKVVVAAEGSEGIEIESASKNAFNLKPGESRVVTFVAKLMKDALPGIYKIEIYAKTETEIEKTSVEIKVNK